MKTQLLWILSFLFPLAASAQLTTTVDTNNVTCNGYNDGSATVIGGIAGASSPILITEVNTNTPDFIELTNVSGTTVNTDGWFVLTSDDYTNINDVNTTQWNLPSSVPANWVDYREDQTGSNYWGNNLFYNNTSPGWVLLSDDNGNIVDFVGWGWTAAQIQNTFNITVSGNNFNITNEWSGNSVPMNSCNTSIIRSGNQDNDDNTDWTCSTTSKGTLNSGLTLPFVGQIGVSYLWSTGDTTSTVDSLAPGTYTVTTTSSQGGSIVDTIIITEPPVPDFNLPGDTNICDGSAIIIDAGAGWNSYAWSTGQVTQTFLTTMPGTYSCTVTDSANCPAVDSMEVGEAESPDVDLGADTTVCDTTYFLNAFNPGATYLWSDGSTGASIDATSTGTYSVTVTSSEGCEQSDLMNLTMFPPAVVDLGDDITLCYLFNGTALLNAGAGFASYLWSNGATSTTLLVGSGVNSPGQEAISVLVTTDDGCEGMDTVIVTYSQCVGIDEANEAEVSLFPNPAQDLVQIQSNLNISQIDVLDLTGKLVITEQYGNSRNNIDFDLSEIEPGTYFIRVQGSESTALERIIKL